MTDQSDMGMYQRLDEENKGENEHVSATPPVQALQDQVRLIDALVNNIGKYSHEVKQKCKQLYKLAGSVPDKIDEQVFCGRYPHGQTITATLEFIEFMICQAQKINIGDEMIVSLGIENIKRLWVQFVKEPNFQSDQALFLDWINKQRTYTTFQYVEYQKKQITYELTIFSEVEKRFLFTQFLCNPDEVDAAQISVSLVKCF